MTTIAGADDVLVPAGRTRVDGATAVVVDPDGWRDHSGILVDDDVVDEVGLALTGRPPRCVGLRDHVRYSVEPHVIEALTP